jgi:hypothetical protein
MKSRLTSTTGLLGMAAAACFLSASPLAAPAANLRLEAQLIWGTNDSKSPNPAHRAAEAQVARKLKSLPFKWSNYFEVNRQRFSVSPSEAKRVVMSKECAINVAQAARGEVEVTFFGKGKQVAKVTQALPKGELLVTGGEAPNFTAWFVVLKQVD